MSSFVVPTVDESLGILVLIVFLLVVGLPEGAHAQERGRSAPAFDPAPTPQRAGTAPGRSQPDWAGPSVPGTRLPPAARSPDPPAVGASPPTDGAGPQGTARTSGPSMEDPPPQAPVGGIEWLAAAGAAYALNRLRNDESDEEPEE